MKYHVTQNGWLEYDGYVQVGEVYEAVESDGYFVLLRKNAITNIVTSREDALKFGWIEQE